MQASPTTRPAWNGYTSGLPGTWTHSAPWRQSVQRRRLQLLDDLARLPAVTAEPARSYLIGDVLEDANTASTTAVGVRKWWWGTEVERAWARLREVEERTIDLLPDDELLAQAARTAAYGATYLEGDDKRLLHLEALRLEAARPSPPTPPASLRAAIVQVLRAAHDEADQTNQEARYLRNRLLLASIFSVMTAAGLLVAQWWFHEAPFIESPPGWAGSPWSLLLVVMLFGALGALFTAIPAMSKVPSDFSPFNLPLQQALLKLVFGPLVAVVGLAILSTDALQTGAPDTWPGLLLLAVVFGAGQQAVTRYVDQRASEILTASTGSATGTGA